MSGANGNEIAGLVRKAVKCGAEVFVRSVDYRQEDRWEPLAVRVDVVKPTENLPTFEASYGRSVRCGFRRFDGAELEQEFLPALVGDAEYSLHEDMVTHAAFDHFSSPVRFRGPSRWCDWPCYYAFRHSTSSSPQPTDQPLVSSRFPFFTSVRELCAQMLEIPERGGGWREDQKLTWLHLVVWDYRVRFGDIAREDETLLLKLEGDDVLKTSVVGRCDYGNGETLQIQESGASEVRVGLARIPESLHLAIIDDDENLITGFHESVFETPVLHRRVVSGSNTEAVERVAETIRRGEGQSTEFKPWLSLGKGQSKKWEMVRAAVSMANTAGGVILVGVDDHGALQEWPPRGPVAASLRGFGTFPDPGERYSEDMGGLLGRYGSALRDLIQKHVSDHIDVGVEVVELDAAHVVLLDIAQGVRKPYTYVNNGTHEYLVRRGATTRPPTVDELRELYGAPRG